MNICFWMLVASLETCLRFGKLVQFGVSVNFDTLLKRGYFY